jgi:DNA topoisomerase-1
MAPRLRRADCSGPGIRRRRRGRGFSYVDDAGERIDDPEVLQRIAELAIPPAWEDVWICPYPNGHLQATGTDAAGRKQYRYHDAWRLRRDREKFDDMVRFAHALPALRRRVAHDLGDCRTLDRRCVLAAAVRLLEVGFFRIGSEEYASENDSYGLATLRKEHVRIEDGVMVFDFPSKSGQRRRQGIADERLVPIVAALKRRRGGGAELLAYKERRRWHDLRSEDINGYVKEATGGDFSAKDFRTWNATALAAVALAVSGESASGSRRARRRAVNRAIEEVAGYLGNTPAVCRASYIDPRVFDAYDAGLTIRPALERVAARVRPGQLPIHQPELERAVLDLIGERGQAPGVEQVAA